MVGSNADEGSVLYHMGVPAVDGGPLEQPTTVSDWDALLAGQFLDQASEVDLAYRVDGDQDVVRAAEQLMADTLFGRHAFYMAQKHGAAGNASYLYFYERHPPTENQTIGASHALELNHVFGGFIPFWPSDERDTELSNEMQTYWAQFARSSDPNTDGLPSWPTFQDLTPQELAFGHDATAHRPVARVARYRAMQQQLERRMSSATVTISSSAGGGG